MYTILQAFNSHDLILVLFPTKRRRMSIILENAFFSSVHALQSPIVTPKRTNSKPKTFKNAFRE